MPAYNASTYIREAIESILNQTLDDFEFIIVNDGSTDDTAVIIRSYSDPRIIFLENEKNSGICVTLNKGLAAARGKYIARMDSDDISLPERLAEQVAFMEQNPEVGASGSDICVFGDGIKPYTFTMVHESDDCKAGLLFNSCFAHPSVIIRRSILENNQLRYKEEFRGLEDYELWWQIGKHSKLANINKVLLKYRHHSGQVTQNVPQKTKDAFDLFVKIRLADLGVDYNEEQLQVFNLYCSGGFNEFNHHMLNVFFSIDSVILKSCSKNGEMSRASTQLVLAKSISYIIQQSPYLSNEKIKLTFSAYFRGLMSFNWAFKQIYHAIFK